MGTVPRIVFTLAVVALVSAAPSPPQAQTVEKRDVDFELLNNFSNLANLQRRQAPNYNQDYTTGGDISFSPSSNGFTLNYDVTQDFVVGKGWTTGDST